MKDPLDKLLNKYEPNEPKLSRLELVQQSFDCCIQVVKSYGPSTLQVHDRNALVTCMEHFKKMYERDCNK